MAYASWRLTPIYDPDPLTASVEGIDDGEMFHRDPGRRFVLEQGGGGFTSLIFWEHKIICRCCGFKQIPLIKAARAHY